MNACGKLALRELAQHQTGSNINRLNLICAQEMLDVSNVIFHEHYSEYITKIVVPSLSQLLADHVGGAIWSIPYSIILAAGLVMLLLFIDPWIAAWGCNNHDVAPRSCGNPRRDGRPL
jgi:hypothetical protein